MPIYYQYDAIWFLQGAHHVLRLRIRNISRLFLLSTPLESLSDEVIDGIFISKNDGNLRGLGSSANHSPETHIIISEIIYYRNRTLIRNRSISKDILVQAYNTCEIFN